MLYRFKAINADQEVVSGQSEATGLDDLERSLQRSGLELLRASPRKQRMQPPSRRELIDFCFHVEQLLTAGIPLIEAIEDLAENGEGRHWRARCRRIATALAAGLPLSDALQTEAAGIDPVFTGVIRAGELSGQLPETLKRLGTTLRQEETLAAGTRKLLLYPAVAGTLVLGTAAFLMFFLVPQIRTFLGETGLPLPLHTRLLFATADLLAGYWPWLLAFPALLLPALHLAIRHSPDLARLRDSWLLKLPLTGGIYRKLLVTRQAELLALLYTTGIPLLEALAALQPTTRNRIVGAALADIHRSVEQGSTLADAFARHAIYPPLLVRMLQIGERTGRLDQTLNNIARRYEGEAADALAAVQTLIEPALTLIIGLLLGWIMLATMQPIYGIIGQAGK